MLKIITLPALKDNYAYLIIDKLQNLAAIVDPVVDPGLVDKILAEQKAVLAFVLTTVRYFND